jgi:hypothetical protein
LVSSVCHVHSVYLPWESLHPRSDGNPPASSPVRHSGGSSAMGRATIGHGVGTIGPAGMPSTEMSLE